MDDLLKSVNDLPDVSFIDNDTLAAIMQRLVSNYEKKYREVTGKAVSLGAADPARIQLYAIALDLYQIEQYVDRAGKQDLLKYSYGEFLDNLAGGRGVHRQQAAAARAQAAPQPAGAAAPAAPPAGAGPQDEVIETLKKFKDLLDAGILTQEEFDAKKKQLLGL